MRELFEPNSYLQRKFIHIRAHVGGRAWKQWGAFFSCSATTKCFREYTFAQRSHAIAPFGVAMNAFACSQKS
ncbi:MAG TPA: hypothetical protein DCP31_16670 [Cyanobacteria bacterium UBA8543]|nr:hypothetical protein [Cyanobacteria bacterium UBA8543]